MLSICFVYVCTCVTFCGIYFVDFGIYVAYICIFLKILSNKESKRIFEIRASYPIEVCDRCFGCGAHIAGERPLDVPWLDRTAKVCKLSCMLCL